MSLTPPAIRPVPHAQLDIGPRELELVAEVRASDALAKGCVQDDVVERIAARMIASCHGRFVPMAMPKTGGN